MTPFDGPWGHGFLDLRGVAHGAQLSDGRPTASEGGASSLASGVLTPGIMFLFFIAVGRQ